MSQQSREAEAIELLQIHYEAYRKVKPHADRHSHRHPTDTRGWSQLLVSALTGLKGIGRRKGPDFADGSDVKAANLWDAIDTPRFNGCIKAGTKSETAGTLRSLDSVPFLFFVMWDTTECYGQERCRVWVVRPRCDAQFRRLAETWYEWLRLGKISNKRPNFQLHPPRNRDGNVFRNNCGNLVYPLLLDARVEQGRFRVFIHDEAVLTHGACQPAAA